MEDIIDIIVTETTNTIEITAQPNDEIIDVNIIDNREDIVLNVTPTVVEININSLTGNFGVNWGQITGTLSNQTDLNNALALKANLVGGKVPASELPSYVDDVVEVANFASLPVTGETGKIYITLDTNFIYRWTGSTYVEIKDSSAVWGAITGTLSSQTDLQNALNAKVAGTGTSGQVAYFNGTSSITSNASFAFTPTSQLLVNNSVTAASAIARGTNLTPTLTAAANNDVLVGLDINPTFTNGAFTGVSNFGLRVNGRIVNTLGNNQVIFSSVSATTGWQVLTLQNTGANCTFGIEQSTGTALFGNSLAYATVLGTSNATALQFGTNALTRQTIFSNGNIGINTTTDAGFRLDVNGTAIFRNTTQVLGSLKVDWNVANIDRGLTFGGFDPGGYNYINSGQGGGWLLHLTTGTSTYNASNVRVTIADTSTTIVRGVFQTTASITAASAIARGVNITNTLVAAANNDVLVGLDINPTFTNGAFTGVTNVGLRVQGINIGLGNGSVITNTAIGFEALITNSTGSENVIIGKQAGRSNTTGRQNVAVGSESLFTNSTGIANVSIGYLSLRANTTAGFNTAVGHASMQNNSTGIQNVAVGQNALNANTGGQNNTAVGQASMQNNQGSQNSAVGQRSLHNNTSGQNNTAMGFDALSSNVTVSNNTAFGSSTLNATTAANNTAIGSFALAFNTTGANNVAIGSQAGRYFSSSFNNLTIANNSIFIGFDTRALLDNQTNQIVIGNQAIGLGSNTTVLGNTSTTLTALYGAVITGGTSVNASAQLQVDGTTKGFLPPRMTLAQRTAIASPATGLIVYQTDGVEGLWLNTSTGWRELTVV
jgi:hypothetical protein